MVSNTTNTKEGKSNGTNAITQKLTTEQIGEKLLKNKSQADNVIKEGLGKIARKNTQLQGSVNMSIFLYDFQNILPIFKYQQQPFKHFT